MGKGGRQVVPAPPLAGPSSRPGSAVSRPGSATASRSSTKDLRHRAAQRRAKDPASDKARLRSKFIEQVKSYIGTPYAERYHKEGDALYGRAAPRGTRRVTTSHGRPRRQGVPGLLRVVPEGAAAIAAGLRV